MTAPTLPSRLSTLAETAPERECLRIVATGVPDLALSRADLLAAARSVAGELARGGVAPGELVILIQQDLATLAATFFGATLLGAIPSIMPFQTEKLHPDRYREATAALIALSGPVAVATEPALADQVVALLPKEPDGRPVLISLTRETLLTGVESLPGDVAIDPEAIALLQHSSGTTGLQKGVALSHRAIFEQLERYSEALGFGVDDVVVSWLPLYHDMGLIAGFLMPLLLRARLVLLSPLEWVRAPHLLLQAISAQGGTFCWLPNFAYNFCAEKIRDEALEGVDLTTMRAFVNCSEPIYESSQVAFAERFAPYGAGIERLATCYAMAETVFAVAQSPAGEAACIDVVDRRELAEQGIARPVDASVPGARRLVSSGQLIPGMAIRVLDSERNPLPDRRVGELAVRSSHMLSEYYHRPDVTAEALHEGWYLTGDLGYIAEGEVYVLGRRKDLLIVGGRNIYPRDLETLINQVEGVVPGRAVVFGIVNPRRGTEDVAVVAEVTGGVDGDGRETAAAIRRAVAAGADVMPRYVELVPRGWLIKTSSGKLARAANREKYLAAHPEIARAD
jgi:fatty-acyl-CoA synthase